jgi:uncharacterized protein YcbK (DUF882 family)
MTNKPTVISRRGVLRAFAATALVAAPTYSNAAGFLRGAGDIRRLKMYSRRTGESLDVIYWIEGDYIKDALTEVNWFMRDWRRDRSRAIDTRTVDIIAATQQLLNTSTPFLMLSGYRTPETNALLRKRSRGVAKNSLAYERASGGSAYAGQVGPSGGHSRRILRSWRGWSLFTLQFCPFRLWRKAPLGPLVSAANLASTQKYRQHLSATAPHHCRADRPLISLFQGRPLGNIGNRRKMGCKA